MTTRAAALTVPLEKVREQVYEDGPSASRSHLEGDDLEHLGRTSLAIGVHVSNAEFRRHFFSPDDPWRDD